MTLIKLHYIVYGRVFNELAERISLHLNFTTPAALKKRVTDPPDGKKVSRSVHPVRYNASLDGRTDRNAIIGVDSAGTIGNFAPVLTEEPGQTSRSGPVPLRGLL